MLLTPRRRWLPVRPPRQSLHKLSRAKQSSAAHLATIMGMALDHATVIEWVTGKRVRLERVVIVRYKMTITLCVLPYELPWVPLALVVCSVVVSQQLVC